MREEEGWGIKAVEETLPLCRHVRATVDPSIPLLSSRVPPTQTLTPTHRVPIDTLLKYVILFQPLLVDEVTQVVELEWYQLWNLHEEVV